MYCCVRVPMDTLHEYMCIRIYIELYTVCVGIVAHTTCSYYDNDDGCDVVYNLQV